MRFKRYYRKRMTITKTMQLEAMLSVIMKMTLRAEFAELYYQDFQLVYKD